MSEETKLNLDYTPDIVPSLYDIHKSFDIIETKRYKGIKGEESLRMVVFTNWVLGRKHILLTGQRSCVTGDSEILLPNGLFYPIKDLINDGIKEVCSYNGEKVVTSEVMAYNLNGEQKVYTLKTKSGKKLDCTENHKFLRNGRWVELKDLSVGDTITNPKKYSLDEGNKLNNDLLKLLAFLLADGGLTQKDNLRYTKLDNVLKEEFKSCLKAFDSNSVIKVVDKYALRFKSSKLFEFLKKNDMFKKSIHKELPKDVFKMN